MLTYALTLSAMMALSGANYYCGLSRYHTLCRYQGVSGNCGTVYSTGVTASQKQQILDIHNRQRSQVASGTTSQPPASNMMELEWDEELANIAQRWTEQCQFDHDCSQCRKVSRFNVGQNLYVSFGYLRDKTDWRQPMEAWFDDEINLFPPSYISPFRYIKKTGHFTQISWATTTKVGCGHTTHTSGRWIAKIYICNYGSAGNAIGKPMYRVGRACSQCPTGTSCSYNYPGLCTGNSFSRGSAPRIDTGSTRFISNRSPVSNFTTVNTGTSTFTSSFPSTSSFTTTIGQSSFPSSGSTTFTSDGSFSSFSTGGTSSFTTGSSGFSNFGGSSSSSSFGGSSSSFGGSSSSFGGSGSSFGGTTTTFIDNSFGSSPSSFVTDSFDSSWTKTRVLQPNNEWSSWTSA